MNTSLRRELDSGRIVRSGKIFCFHKMGIDEIKGVWRYRRCEKCGLRWVTKYIANLMGPIDWQFLNTGNFYDHV
jgi:hypothetical protein